MCLAESNVISKEQIMLAHEEYDEYIANKGNSFVKEKYLFSFNSPNSDTAFCASIEYLLESSAILKLLKSCTLCKIIVNV